MSYPYLSDLINHFLGTHIYLPIAMFGSFVALAIITASWIGKKEVMRYEQLGLLPQAITKTKQPIAPHLLISDLTMICALFGILGARLFHILEYPAEFLRDPAAMIFTRNGLSIYGGLIVGALAGAVF
jgi:phosphatidylglycerol---prolipoprotein diacylglyceryl transferase